jgi:hypothetical protein
MRRRKFRGLDCLNLYFNFPAGVFGMKMELFWMICRCCNDGQLNNICELSVEVHRAQKLSSRVVIKATSCLVTRVDWRIGRWGTLVQIRWSLPRTCEFWVIRYWLDMTWSNSANFCCILQHPYLARCTCYGLIIKMTIRWSLSRTSKFWVIW